MRNFIDIVTKLFLSEAFNSTQRLTWHYDDTPDMQVALAEFQIEDGHFKISFVEKYHSPGIWVMSFTRNGSFDLSHTGRAMTVIATVMQAAREFIAAKDPRWIEFAASVNDPSRDKLYPKLAEILQKEFPHYVGAARKPGRKYTRYSFERPRKPFVPTVVDSQPEHPQVTPDLTDEEWADLEALLSDMAA